MKKLIHEVLHEDNGIYIPLGLAVIAYFIYELTAAFM